MTLKSKPRLRFAVVAASATLLQTAIGFPAVAQTVALGLDSALMAKLVVVPPLAEPTAPTPVNFLADGGDGGKRINLAGRLRMLSQRISGASCNFASGVAPDLSKEVLLGVQQEFASIMAALTNGDEQQGIIGPETRRKTLMQIEVVNGLWSKLDAAVQAVLDGNDVGANIAYISANNLELLNQANILTSEVSGEYSNPADMTQSMAMAVDLAGRQRMLTQKMAKEICGIETGNAALGDVAALQKTMGMFDMTLVALNDGMPAAGINPPPTPEIGKSVTEALADWSSLKADLARVSEAESLSLEAQGELFIRLTQTMKQMNAITMLYTDHAQATK